MTSRQLLSALEAALAYVPAGDTRHLAEDVIADTRYQLGLPPLPESDPPVCGQRCGTCARCQSEDEWVEALSQANLLASVPVDTCHHCQTPLSPFGLDTNGTMHPSFDPHCVRPEESQHVA